MTTVQTALGPIATTELGPTLMHEHVVTRSPGCAGELAASVGPQRHSGHRRAEDGRALQPRHPLDRRPDHRRSRARHRPDPRRRAPLARAHRRRHRRVVDAAALLQRARRRRGRRSVHPRHHPGHRPTAASRPPIIKCATDTAGVTPVIDNVLRASARAQKATGVPISTHTWAAGRTGEMQQAIFAQEGVDLSRVIIGHSGDSEDLGYLRGLMERGSTIGMDRFGLENFLTTSKRVEVVARLCAEGYAGKMVLSHDANCWIGHAVGGGQAPDAAAVELQPHPGRHPPGAPQGGRQGGSDRADARDAIRGRSSRRTRRREAARPRRGSARRPRRRRRGAQPSRRAPRCRASNPTTR